MGPYAQSGFEPTFYPERLDEPLRVKKPAIILTRNLAINNDSIR
jgi:hypothetical protein